MEGATGAFFRFFRPLEAGGRSSRDHEVPDVIRDGYFGMAFVSGIRGTLFDQRDLVSLVFVLVGGHFSALGIHFLNRFLAFASSLLVVVIVGPSSRSRIGVRQDFSG